VIVHRIRRTVSASNYDVTVSDTFLVAEGDKSTFEKEEQGLQRGKIRKTKQLSNKKVLMVMVETDDSGFEILSAGVST